MSEDAGQNSGGAENSTALDRVSSFFGWMVPGGLLLFISFNFFTMFAGCMSGDFSSYSISGSPRLDSPGLPWYVHWSHVSFWYFLPFEAALIALYVLVRVVRNQFADE